MKDHRSNPADLDLINDTDLTVEQVEEKLANGVKIVWGDVELRVERHMMDQARVIWNSARSVMSDEQITTYRHDLRKSIEIGVKKASKGPIDKATADALMNDMCVYKASESA